MIALVLVLVAVALVLGYAVGRGRHERDRGDLADLERAVRARAVLDELARRHERPSPMVPERRRREHR